jgi:hypothetical protein
LKSLDNNVEAMTSSSLALAFKGKLGLTINKPLLIHIFKAKNLASLPIIQEGIHFQYPFLTMGEKIQIHFPKNVFIVVKITTF